MTTPKFAFRVVVFTLAGMVLVYFGVGALLSDRWVVSTTLPVKAPPERIAALAGDFATWPEWSTMNASLGPNTERAVTGAPNTPGHRVTWRGSRGDASLTLVAAGADGIEYEYATRFEGETEQRVRGRGAIRWRSTGDSTEVTWREESPLPQLYERWFALFGAQQEAIQRLQQSSLAGLQRKLE